MAKILLFLAIFFQLSTSQLILAHPLLSEDGNNPYRHVEILDPQGKYRLEWVVDWEKERIHFNVTVETRGFVLFGISKRDPKGNVILADFMIGGVDWRRKSYFTDYHAEGGKIPQVDAKQDWILHSANETGAYTFLSFSRAFDTCDKNDIPINDDTLDLIWAYGESDNTASGQKSVARGTLPVYLRDPDLTPKIIQEGKLRDPDKQLARSEVKVWRVRKTVSIPAKKTTYWCSIHKFDLAQKRHIIGAIFKINNETKANFHHLLLYRCRLPNPAPFFEQFVSHPGEECYSQDRQLGRIPFQSCTELKLFYGIGGRPYFLPESVGFPIGETRRPEYFMLQIHFDNPTGGGDLSKAEAELDIYYTSRLRENDGGVLPIGHVVPGSPGILLQPGTTDHKIFGHCSSNCTRKMLPPEGIKIVGGIIHAHDAGRRLALQHFRRDRELAPVMNDDNWNQNFQSIRILRNEVNVLPGDQLTMRCNYDTTHTNRTTVGGYGREQEACLAFVFYYNLLRDYRICLSELTSPNYTARHLAGTRNVTWDQSRLEFESTAPPHLAGMTLSQISDSFNVNWSAEKREQLKRDHIVLPQVEICPSVQELEAVARNGIVPQQHAFVSYPLGATKYRQPEQCSLSKQ